MANIALYIHQEQTDQHGARCPQATDGTRLKRFMTRETRSPHRHRDEAEVTMTCHGLVTTNRRYRDIPRGKTYRTIAKSNRRGPCKDSRWCDAALRLLPMLPMLPMDNHKITSPSLPEHPVPGRIMMVLCFHYYCGWGFSPSSSAPLRHHLHRILFPINS